MTRDSRAFLTIFILTLFLCLFPPVSALDDLTTYKIVYEGSTPINAAIATKATSAEKIQTIATLSETVMKSLVYPSKSKSGIIEVTITASKYDGTMNTMGYWITATRNGVELSVNNPVWIYPPPYEVVTSESFDSKSNELTVYVKEDPKLAVEQVLQMYAGTLKAGKTSTETKV